MSVTVSGRVVANMVVSHAASCLELVRLTSEWCVPLLRFLRALEERGDARFFAPHSTDEETVRRLACHMEGDLYYLLVDGGEVLAYGLLRGWAEGFDIPSLGIAVHPAVRNLGVGGLLMRFLHVAAARKGATRVRLRVQRENGKAISLYSGLGYVFEEDVNDARFLVGFRQL